MSDKTNMQVPPQIKELAEKTVEQAEKAVAAFLDAAARSVEMVPSPAKEVSKKTLSFTEQNVNAAFEHTRKLLRASDVHEFLQLQSEYLKRQFSTIQDQMKQLGSEMTSSIKSAAPDKSKI